MVAASAQDLRADQVPECINEMGPYQSKASQLGAVEFSLSEVASKNALNSLCSRGDGLSEMRRQTDQEMLEE